MMTIAELLRMPTTLDTGTHQYHESIFRSYNILQTVLTWLDTGASPKMVVEVARQLLDLPGSERKAV